MAGILQAGFAMGPGPLLYLRLAKPLIYNPYLLLGPQIEVAAHSLTGQLDEIDHALDKGKAIGKAVAGAQIKPVIHRVVASARLAGFMHGAKHSGKKLPSDYGFKIKDAAGKRSAKVERLMRRTSKRVLKNTPDSQYVLSSDRAMAAARYEAARSYYKGLADAFQDVAGWGKFWLTSSQSPCDDCQGNEDLGTIPMYDNFDSGHFFPPVHLNCACSVGLELL